MPSPHLIHAGRCVALICGAALAGACPSVTAADLAGSAGRAAAAGRNPVPTVIFDPSVVPAGNAGCCSVEARPGSVRQAGFHQAHAAGCRDGHCVPSCPVRPGLFGYYGTQWRRWPDQGVIQVSAAEAATPAAPPKSAVPRAEEESPAAGAAPVTDELSLEPAAGSEPAAEPVESVPPEAGAGAATMPSDPLLPASRDAAASGPVGPWSRLVAATSLPPGYAPPALPVDEDQ